MQPLGQLVAPRNRAEPSAQSCLCIRSDDIDVDSCSFAFLCHRDCESDDSRFRHRIHRTVLKTAVASTRRNIDDPATTVLLHDSPRGASNIERSHQLRRNHRCDVLIGEVSKRLHPNLSSVVDANVHCSKRVECCLDNCIGPFHRCNGVVVRDSRSAGSNDLGNNFIGGVHHRSIPSVVGVANSDTEIIHHHPSPPRGQEERVLATQTTPGSCDYCDVTIERKFLHTCSLVHGSGPSGNHRMLRAVVPPGEMEYREAKIELENVRRGRAQVLHPRGGQAWVRLRPYAEATMRVLKLRALPLP